MNAPTDIDDPARSSGKAGFALFQYGFRPFFLFGSLYPAVSLVVWVTIWRGSANWQPAMPANIWHGHEMLFGFAAAALAGFMLTAVPNWTGAAALKGPRLVGLFALWLAGRVAAFVPEPSLFMIVDLLFLPALALVLGPAVIARNGRRNGVLIAVLLLLALLNAAVHFDGFSVDGFDASAALEVAVAVFAMLICIIGGRIVPAFTLGGMRLAGTPVEIVPGRVVDLAAILSLALFLLASLLLAPPMLVGGLALAAAVANLVRFWRWQGWRCWRVPLVWSLHLGYAWLIVGLAILGATKLLDLAIGTVGLHALTAGAFGTMILAVMARASLGHTGRPLLADRAITGAFLLVTVGAALRVAAPLGGSFELALIESAALFWAAAFLTFFFRYLPVLIWSRPDGRPG